MAKANTLPYWHPGSQRWVRKIGIKHNRHGERVPASFYFVGREGETPPPDVIADSTIRQREWNDVKSRWPELQPILSRIDPDSDWSGPTWYDRGLLSMPLADGDEIKEAQQADAMAVTSAAVADLTDTVQQYGNLHEMLAMLRASGLLPKGIDAPTRKPTIIEAVNEYIDSSRARIALKIGKRIDVGTHNTSRNNLLISLGLTTGKPPVEKVKIIDLSKPLIGLNQADIASMQKYWFGCPGGVARRTVKNYLDGFKAFLSWAEGEEDLGFARPKKTDEFLEIKVDNDTDVVSEPDLPALTMLMRSAPVRTKMYVALGLFCGWYQKDIATLATNEVHVKDGDTLVTGFRSKESSEAKASTKIKVTHWIPPELATVMRQQKAKENPAGLWFLTKAGIPLVGEKIEGARRNAVSKAYEKLGDRPEFSQLRKWGWNLIQKHATDHVAGDQLSRRWAGQEGGGVSKSYRFSDYAPVIAAQKKWWKEVAQVFNF